MKNGSQHPPVELLERPEPHFPEGRQLPRPGWGQRLVWAVLAMAFSAGIVVTCLTEMVVQVPLIGSVWFPHSVTGGQDQDPHLLLVADEIDATRLEVGQPARVSVGNLTGWGVIVALADIQKGGNDRHVRATVNLVGPDALLQVLPEQGGHGNVLVGFTSTLSGLWHLATSQPPRSERRGTAELRERIPPDLRATRRYERIEQLVASKVGSHVDHIDW